MVKNLRNFRVDLKLQALIYQFYSTDRSYRFVALPTNMETVNFRSQRWKAAQTKSHTDDWALGSHPRDNGHVNSLDLRS